MGKLQIFKSWIVAWLVASNTVVFADPQSTAAQIVRPTELMKRFGTDKFPEPKNPETLKIAVLDIGFKHAKPLNEYLPESARIIDNADYPQDLYEKCSFVPEFRTPPEFDPQKRAIKDEETGERISLEEDKANKRVFNAQPLVAAIDHGLKMTQVVWTMMGKPKKGPQFLMMNAAGLYNLRRAVCLSILEKVDIILYSQNWEVGTNFKGGGFLNKIVNHALDAGIFWVNAAGNFANQIYSGPITIGKDGFLRFSNGKDTLRFASLRAENKVNVVAMWNDVGDEEDSGTDKDLDLYVFNKQGLKTGEPFRKSEKFQVLNKAKLDSDETFLAREKIPKKLGSHDEDFGQDEYFIKIRAHGGSFSSDDRIRVLVNDAELGGVSDNVVFFDATGDDEVMAPADNTHKYMFAVSDNLPTSSRPTVINGIQKPDILIGDSRMEFGGQFQGGASHAAAIFAGILATMKLYMPTLDATVVRHFAKRTRQGTLLDTENEDSIPVDPRAIQEKFSEALIALKQAGAGKVLVGRRRPSGRYVIGIENAPSTLPIFPAMEAGTLEREYNYFVSNDGKNDLGRTLITGHSQRKMPKGETPPDAPPWIELGRSEGDFLEVRKARLQPRIWQPVTPDELDRVVRR